MIVKLQTSRRFIDRSNKDTVKFYNNVHSYSQLILLPFGYTAEPPANIDELTRVANIGNDALYAQSGQVYEVSSCPAPWQLISSLTRAVNGISRNCQCPEKAPTYSFLKVPNNKGLLWALSISRMYVASSTPHP